MFSYIGVIGDIHLEEEFLQLTLDFFRKKKCKPYYPLEILLTVEEI